MQKLTASNLKDVLWETMNNVCEGKVGAEEANAVAAQAREIVRTAKVQVQILNQAQKQMTSQLVDFAEK